MLALCFQVGPTRLALDVQQVREVVPRVVLSPIPHGPAWLAGVFVYRGQVVPVVDLHRLLSVGECPPHLSSRIILVNFPGNDQKVVGLLAAQVAEVRELERLPPAITQGENTPHLGPVLVDTEGILHIASVERLLSQATCRELAAVSG